MLSGALCLLAAVAVLAYRRRAEGARADGDGNGVTVRD